MLSTRVDSRMIHWQLMAEYQVQSLGQFRGKGKQSGGAAGSNNASVLDKTEDRWL
jgi:hypothetical protein